MHLVPIQKNPLEAPCLLSSFFPFVANNLDVIVCTHMYPSSLSDSHFPACCDLIRCHHHHHHPHHMASALTKDLLKIKDRDHFFQSPYVDIFRLLNIINKDQIISYNHNN